MRLMLRLTLAVALVAIISTAIGCKYMDSGQADEFKAQREAEISDLRAEVVALQADQQAIIDDLQTELDAATDAGVIAEYEKAISATKDAGEKIVGILGRAQAEAEVWLVNWEANRNDDGSIGGVGQLIAVGETVMSFLPPEARVTGALVLAVLAAARGALARRAGRQIASSVDDVRSADPEIDDAFNKTETKRLLTSNQGFMAKRLVDESQKKRLPLPI